MATVRVQTILRNKPFGTYIQTDTNGKLSLGSSDASIGSVIVSSIVQNTGFIGSTDTYINTNSLGRDNGNKSDGKFSSISASSSGSNIILVSTIGNKKRVIFACISTSGSVNIKFQDGIGGNDITGFIYMGNKSSLVLPFNPLGHFESQSGSPLVLYLSDATNVGGYITYINYLV